LVVALELLQLLHLLLLQPLVHVLVAPLGGVDAAGRAWDSRLCRSWRNVDNRQGAEQGDCQ
jgi:hypothetical protein